MTRCKSFKKSPGGAWSEAASFFGEVNLVLSDLLGGIGFLCGNAGLPGSCCGGKLNVIFLPVPVFDLGDVGGSWMVTRRCGCGLDAAFNSARYGGAA